MGLSYCELDEGTHWRQLVNMTAALMQPYVTITVPACYIDLSHRAYNLLVGELHCGHNFIKCPVFSACALTLLVGWQVGHPACKKTEWWGACMVICLERGADLHLAQLMPLPLTVSCFSKIQIGFTFLLPAHLGSPGQRAVKWVCVCVLYSVPVKHLALTCMFLNVLVMFL